MLMPAIVGLGLLVLALDRRIAMDPRLAGIIVLGWSVVPALVAAGTQRGVRAAALGPVALTLALALPFLPVEVAMVLVGIALFLLAAREEERPVCRVLPGGFATLAVHGVILLLSASLLLLAG